MKRDRARVEIRHSRYLMNVDHVDIRSKRFNMLNKSIYYRGPRYSGISSKKELLKIFNEICKDTNNRVLYLRHRNPVIKEFSLNMIKHYGKETVLA